MGEELRYVQMIRWSKHIGEGNEQQKGLWGREQRIKTTFHYKNKQQGQENNVYTYKSWISIIHNYPQIIKEWVPSEELRHVQMSKWSKHIGEGNEQQKGLWGREQYIKQHFNANSKGRKTMYIYINCEEV